MAEEKDLMEPLRIQYKGFFDYDGLYKLLRDWLKSHDYKIFEKVFKEKPAVHFGTETELTWEADRKETPFIKYFIKFSIVVSDKVDAEVIKGGVKRSLSKGRIEIIATPSLIYDWQNQFKKGIFPLARKFLWKKVLFREWDSKHSDKLADQIKLLGEDVKKFLNMYAESGITY